MAEESAFRGVIEFFGVIGVYDIVLPFLLVFTIVFARAGEPFCAALGFALCQGRLLGARTSRMRYVFPCMG